MGFKPKSFYASEPAGDSQLIQCDQVGIVKFDTLPSQILSGMNMESRFSKNCERPNKKPDNFVQRKRKKTWLGVATPTCVKYIQQQRRMYIMSDAKIHNEASVAYSFTIVFHLVVKAY